MTFPGTRQPSIISRVAVQVGWSGPIASVFHPVRVGWSRSRAYCFYCLKIIIYLVDLVTLVALPCLQLHPETPRRSFRSSPRLFSGGVMEQVQMAFKTDSQIAPISPDNISSRKVHPASFSALIARLPGCWRRVRCRCNTRPKNRKRFQTIRTVSLAHLETPHQNRPTR